MHRNFEREEHYERGYAERTEAILSRPLTPEVIDTYAEDALNDLIAVVDEVIDTYTIMPTIEQATSLETEKAALRYHGLPDIEATLDHIAGLAGDIQHLNNVIANADLTDSVMLPTRDGTGPEVGSGDGVAEKLLVPRLKTILLILEKDFGINLDSKDELILKHGAMTDSMMRKHSYYSIVVPDLDRQILVNDEEDNATFIFDTEKLALHSLTTDDIDSSSKTELKVLMEMEPDIGRKVSYSQNFTERTRDLMYDIESNPIGSSIESEPATYLTAESRKPGEQISIGSFARGLKLAPEKVVSVLTESSPELFNKLERRKYGRGIAIMLTPEDCITIEAILVETQTIVPIAEESDRSIGGMAKEFGVAHATVKEVVEALEGKLESGEVRRFAVRKVAGYNTADQLAVKNLLIETGKLAPVAPEENSSPKGMSREFGIDREAIVLAIKELGDSLGEVPIHKFGSMTAGSYDPRQKAIIRRALEAKGLFLDKAPQDVISENALAVELNTRAEFVVQAVAQLGDSLTTDYYKFGSKAGIGFPVSEKDLVIAQLMKNGIVFPKAPEGTVPVIEVAERLGLTRDQISRAEKQLAEEIGDFVKFSFVLGDKKKANLKGMTPEQVSRVALWAVGKKK